MTLNIKLPEALASEIHTRQISEKDIQRVVLATLEVWLEQKDPASHNRFNESAAPFVRRLIGQNRELFETLAQS